MAWNPSEQNRVGDYYMQAGQNISNYILAAAKKRDEEKRRTEELERDDAYSTHVMQHALQNGRITTEDYNKFLESPTTKRKGIAAAAIFTMADDWKRRDAEQQNAVKQAKLQSELQRQFLARAQLSWTPSEQDRSQLVQTGPGEFVKRDTNDEVLKLSPEEQADAAKAGVVPLRQSRGSFQYAPGGTGAGGWQPDDQTRTTMKDAGYTFAATGPRGGRWINTNGADADLDENGMPIYSTDGALVQSGGKMKPVTAVMQSAKMLNDVKAESKKGQAQSQPGFFSRLFSADTSATPTPTPAQREGIGGYLPGRRYGGKLYLGGDPNDPKNWQ